MHGSDDAIRLAGGVGISFLGKVAGRLFQVAMQVVFARTLGMADFGRFAIGMTILRIFSVAGPLGLHRTAVVFGSRYVRTDPGRFLGVAVETVGMALGSGVIFAAALIWKADWVSASVFNEAIPAHAVRLFAVAVPFASMLRVAADLCRVSQRMDLAAFAEDMVQPIAALAIFASFLAVSDGLELAIYATIAAYGLAGVVSLVSLVVLFPDAFLRRHRVAWGISDVVGFSGPIALANLAGALLSMLDRLVVGRYCAPDEMAAYQAAAQVSVAFTIVMGSFTAMFTPMAARFLAEGDLDRLAAVFRTSTRWGLYLGLPLFLWIGLVPGEILRFTFGETYGTGQWALIVLATGQLINVATGNVGVLLMVAGQQQVWLAISLAAMIVNGAVGVMLVAEWGIVGAAVGNLLATLTLYGLGTLFVWLRLRLWAWRRGVAKPVFAAVVATAITALVLHAASLPSNALVVVTSAFSVGTIFFGVCWLLGLEADDKSVLTEISARLRLRRS